MEHEQGLRQWIEDLVVDNAQLRHQLGSRPSQVDHQLAEGVTANVMADAERLREELTAARWGLGLAAGQQIARSDDPPSKYRLPNGEATNNCDEARSDWMTAASDLGSHATDLATQIRNCTEDEVVRGLADKLDALVRECIQPKKSKPVTKVRTG